MGNILQMAKANFKGLLDDLAELDKRRGADFQIMKALRAAGDAVRDEQVFQKWVRDLRARGAAASRAEDNGQAQLFKSVAHATSLLKSAVADGKLTALEACQYEARIH